jgi:hypothetical protein
MAPRKDQSRRTVIASRNELLSSDDEQSVGSSTGRRSTNNIQAAYVLLANVCSTNPMAEIVCMELLTHK